MRTIEETWPIDIREGRRNLTYAISARLHVTRAGALLDYVAAFDPAEGAALCYSIEDGVLRHEVLTECSCTLALSDTLSVRVDAASILHQG